MKVLRKYRITIEDESRLRQIVTVSARPYKLWIAGIATVLVCVALAVVAIMLTPLKTLLPGYLKHGERSTVEKGMLRIDSLKDVYSVHSRYLSNIMTVLDTERTPTDSVLKNGTPNQLPPDSLLPASPREREFISRMKERERYNIDILAPIAGDQLQLFPVANGAIVTEQAQDATKARIITPVGAGVCAITDGRVLAVQNISPEGGAAIVMQHDNGFATRYSHLGTPTVAPGDHVDGGTVIALGSTGGAVAPGFFYIEIWYDGTPLPPAGYIKSNTSPNKEEPYTLSGFPMGR